MSDWVETTLGDVTTRRTDFTKVDLDTDYAILGLQRSGWGFVRHDPKRGRDQKFTKLMSVGKDELVYRTITAFEAPSSVVGEAQEGLFVTPQTFPVFRLDHARVLPGYVKLLTTWPQFHHEMAVRCTGTVLRRRTLSIAAFASIRIRLPTLSEQRRIVDVMAAVDAQIEALKLEVESHRAFLAARRAELVDNDELESVPAGQAFDILMGRQRSPERAIGPSMTPYLRSANVGVGVLNLADVKEMDFDPKERTKYSLASGDVLVSEGSASEKAVGMASVWLDEMDGPVCFQNTLLRYRAIDGMSVPSFVNHWCKWAFESGTFRDAASGTNIKHIGSTRAVTMPVALPVIQRQESIAAELDSVEAGWETRATELRRLGAYRSALLSSLLTQDVEIPESYDTAIATSLEVAS